MTDSFAALRLHCTCVCVFCGVVIASVEHQGSTRGGLRVSFLEQREPTAKVLTGRVEFTLGVNALSVYIYACVCV